MALLLMSILVGCRASPFGFLFAISGDLATEADVKEKRKKIVGLSMSEAEPILGERIDSLVDTKTNQRFVRFRPSNLFPSDNFYLVRVGPDARAQEIAWWMEGHDGSEDTIKLMFMKPKVEGKTAHEAMIEGELGAPIFVFRSDATTDVLWVFDVTNFTHLAPRLLILNYDNLGKCVKAAYYGVAGGNAMWAAPEETESGEGDGSTDSGFGFGSGGVD
jgi:hypothetical protein